MAKAELKTKKNNKSVKAFIESLPNEKRRKDAQYVLSIMKEITGKKPYMWGDRIVGFDDHTYKYKTGREVDFFIVGFSARKDMTTLYIMPGYQDFGDLLEKLGPYKKGAACLYIRDMDKIHKPTLKKIIKKGYQLVKKQM